MSKNNTSPCSICKHKSRQTIEKRILAGSSLASLERYYRVSRTTLRKHRDYHMNQKELKKATDEANSIKPGIDIEYVEDKVRAGLEKMERLVDAIDYQLQDPDDPSKYFAGVCADEIRCSYFEVDPETGKRLALKRSATLQELISMINQSTVARINDIKVHQIDTRKMLLESIDSFSKLLGMILNEKRTEEKMRQSQIEWEHKRRLLEKANKEGGELEVKQEIEKITQSVILKLQGTDELSKEAGLE